MKVSAGDACYALDLKFLNVSNFNLSQLGTNQNNLNGFLIWDNFFDKETLQYYVMARYYNSQDGRFLSRDAVPFKNLYVYSFNSPVSLKDSSGNMPVSADGDRCLSCMYSGKTAKIIKEKEIVRGFDKMYGSEIDSNLDFSYGHINKKEHQYRNVINDNYLDYYLSSGHDLYDIMDNWTEAPPEQSVYHKHSAPYNAKYIGPETKWGQPEVVINTLNMRIDNTPQNMGTWNYGIGLYNHTIYDVAPYYLHGNNSQDYTSITKK